MSDYKQMENEEAGATAVTIPPSSQVSQPQQPPAYYFNPMHSQYPPGAQVPMGMMSQPMPSTNMTSNVTVGGGSSQCTCCCCSCPNWVCCLILILFVLAGIGAAIAATIRH